MHRHVSIAGSPAHLLVKGVVVAALLAATGCGARSGVPRPFPGAPLPPGLERPRSTTPTPAPPAAESGGPPGPGFVPPVVATALTYRGTPYRNGGSNPSGFDCSGFVQWVFARHGTQLPREVKHQYEMGVEIDREAVQPGDLVFFETLSRGPSHVGIALGGSEFVHAPSSRGVVRVERYDRSYWSSRWLGARRVVRDDEPQTPAETAIKP